MPNPKEDEKAQKTISKFQKSFASYEKDTLVPAIPELYSEDAYVNDRIHSVRGRQNIKDYFEGTFEKLHEGSFDFTDIFYGDDAALLRWHMHLQLGPNDKKMSVIGMSQLRFNKEGKIIFHLDYWDYSEILGDIGGIKYLIHFAKSRS